MCRKKKEKREELTWMGIESTDKLKRNSFAYKLIKMIKKRSMKIIEVQNITFHQNHFPSNLLLLFWDHFKMKTQELLRIQKHLLFLFSLPLLLAFVVAERNIFISILYPQRQAINWILLPDPTRPDPLINY